MQQALVFRLNSNEVLSDVGWDYIPVYYYVDILDEKDIMFYLYNNNLRFFIDKYLFINNDKYYLKSILLDFSCSIETTAEDAKHCFVVEYCSHLQKHDMFCDEFNLHWDTFIKKPIFSYTEENDTIFVKNDLDLVHKLFYFNKDSPNYFVKKNNKLYLRSIYYDLNKEVSSTSELGDDEIV